MKTARLMVCVAGALVLASVAACESRTNDNTRNSSQGGATGTGTNGASGGAGSTAPR
jgi:hypothetical protein